MLLKANSGSQERNGLKSDGSIYKENYKFKVEDLF